MKTESTQALEALSFITSKTIRNGNDIIHMNKNISILENFIHEAHQLEKAVNETIEENLHLADGDNCTLFKLKRAVSGESDRVDDLIDEARDKR